MRTLCGTILAAVAAFQAVAGIDCVDMSVADFPRLAGESGDSARIMRAVEAAGNGGIVWFPRGESKGSRRYDMENILWQSGLTLLVPQWQFNIPKELARIDGFVESVRRAEPGFRLSCRFRGDAVQACRAENIHDDMEVT